MSFMRSEDREMQACSVEIVTDLGDAEQIYWANHHMAIVDRFGCFSHRNALIGRTSTPEEIEFLHNAEPLA